MAREVGGARVAPLVSRTSWFREVSSQEHLAGYPLDLKPSRAPWGSRCKAFLRPPFLHYRKQASFGFLDRPCLPSAAFKQLLIRAARGCRDTGGAMKKQ